MILLFMLTIFVIIVASVWWAGFWSNTVMFVNMLIGALVATAFFGNVTNFVLTQDSSWNYVAPFASIWGLFFVTTAVLRACTDAFSRIKLKFDILTEMIGRSLMSLAVGMLFITFASFTMHLAPLPPNFMGDSTGMGGGRIVRSVQKPPIFVHMTDQGADISASDTSVIYAIGPEVLWETFLIYWSNWTLSESYQYCLVDRLQELNSRKLSAEDLEGQRLLRHRPWRPTLLMEYYFWRKELADVETLRVSSEK